MPDLMQRDLTTRTLTLRADSVDEKGRTVEATVSTENPVLVFDWNRWELVEEVLLGAGAKLPARGVPLLETHRRYSTRDVLGSIRDLRNENGQIVGRLHFAEGDGDAERAWQMVRQGHIQDVSAGYRVKSFQEIKPGESKVVGGRKFTAGKIALRVTTDWDLKEGSLVPIGADEGAKMRSEAMALFGRSQIREGDRSMGDTMDTAQVDEREERGDEATGQREAPAKDEAERKPAPETRQEPADTEPAKVVDVSAAVKDAVRKERQRVAMIRSIAGTDVPEADIQRAIDEDWTVERMQKHTLDCIREKRPERPGVNAPGVFVREASREAVAYGLLQRIGAKPYLPNPTEKARKEADDNMERGADYAGLSLIDFCREILAVEGVRVPSRDYSDIVRAAVSTPTFAYVFTTSMNAQLMQSFTEAGDTTRGWCSERDVQNFLQQDRIVVSPTTGLSRLPAGGTANDLTLDDGQESYKIARYAGQIKITEQDLINDTMGALTDIPMRMGQSAARLRPDLIYALILANATMRDGVALFDATTHGNYGTTSTALATTTLEAKVAAMAKQTVTVPSDYGGKSIILNVQARYLITPVDLWATAAILIGSGMRYSSSGDLNPLRGLNLEHRADNRMGVGVTDPATGTARTGGTAYWMLAASPQQVPTIEVGYRAGTNRSPQVRAFTLDRGEWGIGWDINMDIGAKALDWRGLALYTGAS